MHVWAILGQLLGQLRDASIGQLLALFCDGPAEALLWDEFVKNDAFSSAESVRDNPDSVIRRHLPTSGCASSRSERGSKSLGGAKRSAAEGSGTERSERCE